MLPYSPLHHILMKELDIPVVATSGNISEEPICISEDEAYSKLSGIADYFLVHNRRILRHVDDSILRIAAGNEVMIRRARGYAPLPLVLNDMEGKTVLEVGAHLIGSSSRGCGIESRVRNASVRGAADDFPSQF